MVNKEELEKLKRNELCDYCRKHGIPGYSGKTKAERISLILNFYKIIKDPKLKIEEDILYILSSGKKYTKKYIKGKLDYNDNALNGGFYRLIQKELITAEKQYKPHPSGRGLSREFIVKYSIKKPKSYRCEECGEPAKYYRRKDEQKHPVCVNCASKFNTLYFKRHYYKIN